MVDKSEFEDALKMMLSARAWLRYCPACIYANTCDYCQECNANCDECNEDVFCGTHWADHPARTVEDVDETGAAIERHPFGSPEFLRRHLVIRPLSWAYHSKAMSWVPTQHKAVLRQALRNQQLAAQESAAAAEQREAAALAQMNGGGIT